MFIPKSLYYTKDHLWLMKVGSGQFFIGITDYAQRTAGKINKVELNLQNTEIKKNILWGKIYGKDSILQLVLPFDCVIENISSDLKHSLINMRPYSNWFIRVSAEVSCNSLLCKDEYEELIKGPLELK